MLIPKITCVICPFSGEYFMASGCYKCPYFKSDIGKTIDCTYEVEDKIKAEPSVDSEWKTKW